VSQLPSTATPSSPRFEVIYISFPLRNSRLDWKCRVIGRGGGGGTMQLSIPSRGSALGKLVSAKYSTCWNSFCITRIAPDSMMPVIGKVILWYGITPSRGAESDDGTTEAPRTHRIRANAGALPLHPRRMMLKRGAGSTRRSMACWRRNRLAARETSSSAQPDSDSCTPDRERSSRPKTYHRNHPHRSQRYLGISPTILDIRARGKRAGIDIRRRRSGWS